MDRIGAAFDSRDLAALRLRLWGSVVPSDGVVRWLVVDTAGVPVSPIAVHRIGRVSAGVRRGKAFR